MEPFFSVIFSAIFLGDVPPLPVLLTLVRSQSASGHRGRGQERVGGRAGCRGHGWRTCLGSRPNGVPGKL